MISSSYNPSYPAACDPAYPVSLLQGGLQGINDLYLVNLPAKGKQDMQDRKRQDMNDLYNFLPCFKIKNN